MHTTSIGYLYLIFVFIYWGTDTSPQLVVQDWHAWAWVACIWLTPMNFYGESGWWEEGSKSSIKLTRSLISIIITQLSMQSYPIGGLTTQKSTMTKWWALPIWRKGKGMQFKGVLGTRGSWTLVGRHKNMIMSGCGWSPAALTSKAAQSCWKLSIWCITGIKTPRCAMRTSMTFKRKKIILRCMRDLHVPMLHHTNNLVPTWTMLYQLICPHGPLPPYLRSTGQGGGHDHPSKYIHARHYILQRGIGGWIQKGGGLGVSEELTIS